MKQAKKSKAEEKVISFETFMNIGQWQIMHITQNEPSCFNGFVSIRKRRVTIELIDEPVEVLAERLQKLWDESDNYHHYEPLKKAAAAIGYEFVGSKGSKRSKSQ